MEATVAPQLSVTRKVAFVGVLGALTVLLGSTPIGLIPTPWGLNVTILHIPTILGALLLGPVGGVGIGAIFGISSMVRAISNPVGLSIMFTNPLISILPRVLFGLTAWLVFSGLGKVRVPKVLAATIAAVVGTLLHTTYVFLAMIVFAGGQVTSIVGGVKGLFLLFLPNAVAETIAAGIIVTAVVSTIYATVGRKSKLSQMKEVE